MKGVVLEEGHLVRLAAGGGLHVQILKLVRGARCRGVDEALAVVRNVRLGAVQRLLRKDDGALFDAAGPRRNPVDVAAAESHVPVRHDQEFVAAREPRGRDVHVPGAEVESVAPEGIVRRDRDLGAGPAAVRKGADIDVEVPAWRGGYERDPVA